MVNRAVFLYENYDPQKTEITEGMREWNNVFAHRTDGDDQPGAGTTGEQVVSIPSSGPVAAGNQRWERR